MIVLGIFAGDMPAWVQAAYAFTWVIFPMIHLGGHISVMVWRNLVMQLTFIIIQAISIVLALIMTPVGIAAIKAKDTYKHEVNAGIVTMCVLSIILPIPSLYCMIFRHLESLKKRREGESS